MKKLPIENRSYKVLLEGYSQWLDILGYAESTVYNLPNHAREFLYYLEQNGHTELNSVTVQIIKDYYVYLQRRSNERRKGGGLSKSYLNKHQQGLKKFKEYLEKHGHTGFKVHLKTEVNPVEEKLNILTQAEIQELFTATNYSHTEDRFRLRDKALLVVFYSCGLRRTESVSLDIHDVYFEKGRLHVRKGKNYKKRYVPLNQKNLRILEDYLYESRPTFYNGKEEEALFLNTRGTRLGGMSFANRLHAIIKAAANKTIEEKGITLHSLRHSIATHLLQSGVPLSVIKTFLGHSSLESTQIYTHLIKTIDHESL